MREKHPSRNKGWYLHINTSASPHVRERGMDPDRETEEQTTGCMDKGLATYPKSYKERQALQHRRQKETQSGALHPLDRKKYSLLLWPYDPYSRFSTSQKNPNMKAP